MIYTYTILFELDTWQRQSKEDLIDRLSWCSINCNYGFTYVHTWDSLRMKFRDKDDAVKFHKAWSD